MKLQKRKSRFWSRLESYDDVQRTNYMSMQSHFIIVIVLQLLALLRFLTAQSTIAVLAASSLAGFIPVFVELFLYKKDPKNRIQQHWVGYGFALYYTIVLFTGTTVTIFAVAIPMMVMIMIFNDVRYTLMINVGLVIETLILSVLMVKTGGFGYAGFDAVVIQNLAIILLTIFSVWTAKTIDINEKQKLNKIETLMSNTEDSITDIYKDLNSLSESSSNTSIAMEQVAQGATETAEAVAQQMEQTHVIREKTENVATSTKEMNTHIDDVMNCVRDGANNMSELLGRVDDSVSTTEDVERTLAELTKNLDEMNGIVKLISDIAFQTNLLALNANVEAAHAGEAGRGFAVVATEVAEMSIRTKDATEQIEGMIGAVSESMKEVTGAINQMVTGINTERECADRTRLSFDSIEQNTKGMSVEAQNLLSDLSQLTDANMGIVNTIEKISAASEQVSALADNAQAQEKNNANVLDGISQKMQNLVESM